MPLQRRIPKRGFRNPFRKVYAVVNVQELNRFDANSQIDRAALVAAGLISTKEQGIKILGDGELKVALNVNVDKVSDSARSKIEAAGGSVTVAA